MSLPVEKYKRQALKPRSGVGNLTCKQAEFFSPPMLWDLSEDDIKSLINSDTTPIREIQKVSVSHQGCGEVHQTCDRGSG
ncbi:hypothetical protein AVEN_77431-1 [Araneus ventricosus]|uniref:Uncharacterized protein n=1 Tax=Araneus ventricosus TaxID=182803 RepID=A0A4Y2RUF4_ARAVE|nr:hypothetical protein AVEN_77431-1 [Araneus ventricosus]